MKCPNCGQEINEKVCPVCGCTIIGNEELKKVNPEENFAKQKPRASSGSAYRQSRASNSFFGGGFGGGLFGSIFGNIFDIFGGGFDESDDEDDDYGYYDDFGNPMPIDIYGRDFVEIKEIELFDSEGNKLEKGEKKQSKVKKVIDKLKDKLHFNKEKDDDNSDKDSFH